MGAPPEEDPEAVELPLPADVPDADPAEEDMPALEPGTLVPPPEPPAEDDGPTLLPLDPAIRLLDATSAEDENPALEEEPVRLLATLVEDPAAEVAPDDDDELDDDESVPVDAEQAHKDTTRTPPNKRCMLSPPDIPSVLNKHSKTCSRQQQRLAL